MRPNKDITWLKVARDLAEQSTCLRRNVGCVLIDVRGRILSTGWNGVAAGQPHCNEMDTAVIRSTYSGLTSTIGSYPHACPGARAPSGTALDLCQAIHAEQNALMQCRDVYEIHTCYCTASPCVTCTKLLLNTSCKRVIYLEEYSHSEARELWFNGDLRMQKVWKNVEIPG